MRDTPARRARRALAQQQADTERRRIEAARLNLLEYGDEHFVGRPEPALFRRADLVPYTIADVMAVLGGGDD